MKTYKEAEDEAFYFSGLVAQGSFEDMDEYDQEAVLKYGKMMYDYGKEARDGTVTE
jgi:hypothetical protein